MGVDCFGQLREIESIELKFRRRAGDIAIDLSEKITMGLDDATGLEAAERLRDRRRKWIGDRQSTSDMEETGDDGPSRPRGSKYENRIVHGRRLKAPGRIWVESYVDRIPRPEPIAEVGSVGSSVDQAMQSCGMSEYVKKLWTLN